MRNRVKLLRRLTELHNLQLQGLTFCWINNLFQVHSSLVATAMEEPIGEGQIM